MFTVWKKECRADARLFFIMDINGLHYDVKRAGSGEEFIQTDLVVLFLIEGQMTVRYQGDDIPMRKEDILLINPGMNYEIRRAGGGTLYGTAAYPLRLTTQILGSQNVMLYADSAVDTGHSYQDLRDLLLEMTAEYTAREHRTGAYMVSLLLRLLDTLIENYRLEEGNVGFEEKESDVRMRTMMRYIISHVNDEISLTELADSMYISTSTLSRIFRKSTGIYFADYVMQLRVKSALGLLKNSDQNLTQIAMNCGFSNSAAFNRAFRKVMDMTPSEYRQKTREAAEEEKKRQEKEEREIREILKGHGYQRARRGILENVTLDLDRLAPRPYRKVWSEVINIGDLYELTRANTQFHILELHERLHFRYIRIWNIFSVKIRLSDGETMGQYNFDVMDQVLDFLVQHHLKPFLDFGKRPDMAMRSDGKSIFYLDEYIPFKSRKIWEDLVESFFSEILHRYGEEEVSGWIFELSRDSIHGDSQTRIYEDPHFDFFNAWSFLYHCVKTAVPGALVGGPNALTSEDRRFLEKFYPRSVAQGCAPDFASIQLLPREWGSVNRKSVSQEHPVEKESIEIGMIHEMKDLMKRTGIGDRKLFVTEWNYSISNRNFLNDSCFRSAYLVSGIEEMWGETDLMAVMSGTDWVSSYMDTKGIVNGGIGLLTRDMIRKPAFFALDFLNQLGPLFLSKGRRYIATKKENGHLYILCFYYAWFRRNNEMTGNDTDLRRLYQRHFEDEEPMQLDLSLKGLVRGKEYTVKKRSLSRHSGSILDEWEKFDFDTKLSREDIKYLQNVSEPKIELKRVYADADGGLMLHVRLEPLEVVLLHIYS